MKINIKNQIILFVLLVCILLIPFLGALAEDREMIPDIESLGESITFYNDELPEEEIESLSKASMIQGMRTRNASVNATFERGERIEYGTWSTNFMYLTVGGNRTLAY